MLAGEIAMDERFWCACCTAVNPPEEVEAGVDAEPELVAVGINGRPESRRPGRAAILGAAVVQPGDPQVRGGRDLALGEAVDASPPPIGAGS
jgi:hypothetical protein